MTDLNYYNPLITINDSEQKNLKNCNLYLMQLYRKSNST